jgi:predicted phage tail protein
MLDFTQKTTVALITVALCAVLVVVAFQVVKAFAKYGVIAAIVVVLGGSVVAFAVAHVLQAPSAVESTRKEIDKQSGKFNPPDIPTNPVGR